MTDRTIKIAEELKREIYEIISREIKDPRIPDIISIVHVDLTKDLKHCKVYFSTLEDYEKKIKTKEGLDSAKGYIKHILGKQMRIRVMPDIDFIIDTSIEDAIRMNDLINKTISEDGENNKK